MSLVELTIVLMILMAVVGGLAVMLESGARSQVNVSRRLEAQQEARLALLRMRKELHCANALSATPSVAVASITAVIPAACLGLAGPPVSVQYTTSAVAAGRWSLNRVSGGVPLRLADYVTTSTPFTYTPASANRLASVQVLLPVDINTTDSVASWRVTDTIVLRNTVRQ